MMVLFGKRSSIIVLSVDRLVLRYTVVMLIAGIRLCGVGVIVLYARILRMLMCSMVFCHWAEFVSVIFCLLGIRLIIHVRLVSWLIVITAVC